MILSAITANHDQRLYLLPLVRYGVDEKSHLSADILMAVGTAGYILACSESSADDNHAKKFA